MHDVRVQLVLEPLVRVELAAAVELVLQVAEHLLGRRVVQAVALAAHRLSYAQFPEPFAPPRVLVPPSHVRVQYGACAGGQLGREHGEQTLLLFHVGMPADVPGHDLLAGHVIDRREIGLGARDLELGDVGAELGERPVGPEVALEQVRHPFAVLAPVRAVLPPGVRRPYPALEPHAAHDPGTVLADTLRPNSWTRHMWICRCPHSLAVLPQTAAISGSRSARVTCSG